MNGPFLCSLWQRDKAVDARWYSHVPRIGDVLLIDGREHTVERVRWPEGLSCAEACATGPQLVIR